MSFKTFRMRNKINFYVFFLILNFSGFFQSQCLAILCIPPDPVWVWWSKNPLESVSDYPFLSSDTLRLASNFRIDETCIPLETDDIKDGDIVYVMHEIYLDYFFKYVHSHIKSKYILITHFGDASIPGPYANYLDSENLAFWFTQNIDGTIHPKLIPIPLGIPIKGLYYHNPFEALLKIMAKASTILKKHWLYLNFTVTTNPGERNHAIESLKNKPFCYLAERKDYPLYLEDMASSEFVLSPLGFGIDCYRTWEALLVGSIPIVKRSSIASLYEGLPVVIVDNYQEITAEFLILRKQEMLLKSFNKKRLFADYWINLIYYHQKLVRMTNPKF